MSCAPAACYLHKLKRRSSKLQLKSTIIGLNGLAARRPAPFDRICEFSLRKKTFLLHFASAKGLKATPQDLFLQTPPDDR